MKPEVLVIGLDGATLSLMESPAVRDWMPNISRLIAEGCRGPLRSTVPPYTPPAWASIYTGTNPTKHGVFAFTRINCRTHKCEYHNYTTIATPKLWQILNKNGIRRSIFRIVVEVYPASASDSTSKVTMSVDWALDPSLSGPRFQIEGTFYSAI